MSPHAMWLTLAVYILRKYIRYFFTKKRTNTFFSPCRQEWMKCSIEIYTNGSKCANVTLLFVIFISREEKNVVSQMFVYKYQTNRINANILWANIANFTLQTEHFWHKCLQKLFDMSIAFKHASRRLGD